MTFPHRPVHTVLTLLLVWAWCSHAVADDKTRTNRRDGAKMVLVPAGQFLMGSTPEAV